MDKIKQLETQRVLRELDFLETDYNYRKEVVSSADPEFLKSVNQFLEENPELKEQYDTKVSQLLDEALKNFDKQLEELENLTEEEKFDDFDNWDNEEIVDNGNNLKKLYREIVKLTHPDIVRNKRLNELYLKAGRYYESKNKIGIFAICNELNIPYEISSEDIESIMSEIMQYREKIHFLESTYTWKWYYCKDDESKRTLIVEFINQKLR